MNSVITFGLSSPVLLSSLGAFEVLALAIAVPVAVALFLFRDKFANRAMVFALAVCGIYAAETWWGRADPEKSIHPSIAQVNAGVSDTQTVHVAQDEHAAANAGAAGAAVLAACLCFGRYGRVAVDRFRLRSRAA